MAYDIFISYSRVNIAEVEKFWKLFDESIKIFTTRTKLIPFFDRDSIELGSIWKSELQKGAQDSVLMFAFLTPKYFTSQYCLDEWDYFYNRFQENESVPIIFPIEIVQLEDEVNKYFIKDKLDDEQRKRYDQAVKMQILPWIEIKNDEKDREKFLKSLSRIVDKSLSTLKPRDPRLLNTHIIDKHIDKTFTKEKKQEIKEKLNKEKRAFPDKKPVCLIYTGGTVGMVREDEKDRASSYKIGEVEEIIKHIYKLKELDVDIDFYSYKTPLDSSNIDSLDWIKLAKIIKELYAHYQGFVILHGANTMAHTAAALSFMFVNLNKPVILTGAEIPLADLESDAEVNVIHAIKAASPELESGLGNVPEVCIMYGNDLLRGNRATKWHSLDKSKGFFSPNYPAIGAVKHDRISLDYKLIRNPDYNIRNDSSIEIKTDMEKYGIVIIKIYPDMEIKYYRKIFRTSSLKGVLIETYGPGNVPDLPKEFLDELELLVKKGIIVINLTQCPHGDVKLLLHETNARLFDIGVINGGDMTTEAAYCKLKWLIGQYIYGQNKSEKDKATIIETIKKEMQINKRGELTYSAYSIKYSTITDKTIANPIFRGNPKDINFNFDIADIDHAYLRIQGIKIKDFIHDELLIKFYYDRNNISLSESEEDLYYRLGFFKRRISDKNKFEEVSQNLEVTEKIRRLVRPRSSNATIQVVSANHHEFEFDSLELIIFTKV